MSRNYKFHNSEGMYFVSFAVVNWIDVFTRPIYVNVLIESLEYCQKNKGMDIIAWCIMTNHVHLIFRSVSEIRPENILGDFKRHTSKRLIKSIKENPQESRKKWMLKQFSDAGLKSSNVDHFQFWRHDNKPVELWSHKVIDEKVNYIHNNPVKQGIVIYPSEYVYSSAKVYAGDKGLLKVTLVG